MNDNKECEIIDLPSGGRAGVRGYLTNRERIAITSKTNEESIMYAVERLLVEYKGKTNSEAVEAFLNDTDAADCDTIISKMIEVAQSRQSPKA